MIKFRLTKIRYKILLNFSIILVLSGILGLLGYYSVNQVLKSVSLGESSMRVNELMLKVRASEKNFLMRDTKDAYFMRTGDSKYVDDIRSNIDKINSILINMEKTNHLKELKIVNNVDLLKVALENYEITFEKLRKLYLERGFKDFGNEGELRKAIHDIEDSGAIIDKVKMLMLRRHEKDFFLRADLKYVDKFHKEIDAFKLSLKNDSNLIKNLNVYESKFDQVVESTKMIGLDQESGMRGVMRGDIIKVEPIVKRIKKEVDEGIEQVVFESTLIFFIVLLLEIGLGLLLSVKLSNGITEKIEKLKAISENLSKGIIKDEEGLGFVEVNMNSSNDEADEMALMVENLREGLQKTLEFANAIGDENYDAEFEKLSEEDALGAALLDMRDKLKEAKNKEYRSGWITKGLAKFGEILREDKNDLKILSDAIISQLIKYLDANQGSMFLINDGDKKNVYLELTASYAWSRKKFKKKEILLGEGLVGRCWQEEERIYLTDIPEDYITITSGLGEANPRNILIVPLKIEEEVYGIIEIASFNKIQDYQIEFIEKLVESIALTISKMKNSIQTTYLLEESKEMTEELRAQEEEMRQNMEEMQSTQEELMKVTEEKDRRIAALEKGLEGVILN